MNRLSRLLAIQTQLQARRVVRAKDIAERFGISLRTVYRDIRALQEAGIPISGEAGHGYYLMEGFTLPPVSFTEEEANALVTAEKFVEQNAEGSFIEQYGNALTKIRAVMRGQEKDRADLLSARISSATTENTASDGHYLADIQKAITNFQLAKLEYLSIYKEELTKRIIEPFGLYFKEDKWVLIAYCQLREDIREFRLDRIQRLRVLSEKSVRAQHFDLAQYFQELIEKYSQ